jgi:hypothetical protein
LLNFFSALCITDCADSVFAGQPRFLFCVTVIVFDIVMAKTFAQSNRVVTFTVLGPPGAGAGACA